MKQSFIEKYGADTPVRALSWKQPFASLMLHGKVETRVWDSRYYGWVLICSSQKMYNFQELESISGDFQVYRAMNKLGGTRIKIKDRTKWMLEKSKIPCGQAIAIGYLNRSHPMIPAHSKDKDNIENLCFVKCNENLFMHHYSCIEPIEPFDWKGKQGWSTLTQEQKSKIILL